MRLVTRASVWNACVFSAALRGWLRMFSYAKPLVSDITDHDPENENNSNSNTDRPEPTIKRSTTRFRQHSTIENRFALTRKWRRRFHSSKGIYTLRDSGTRQSKYRHAIFRSTSRSDPRV